MSAQPERPEDLFVMEWVEIAGVRIPTYQRPERKNIDKLRAEWNIRFVAAIVVSLRDSVLWAVDGQTRIKVANQLGIARLPAIVHFGLTEAEEAQIFLALNRDSKRVSAIARHIAEAISGSTRALAIDEVLERHGLQVRASNIHGTGKRHESGLAPFSAIGKAEDVFNWGGPELLSRTLSLIDDCFPGEYGRFRGQMVAGLGYFLAHDPWDADDKQVIKALRPVTTAALDDRARHAQALSSSRTSLSAHGSPIHMARGIASLVYRDRGLEWKAKR